MTLRPNGGTINSGYVTAYDYGKGVALPTDVTREGYTFAGWYDNANFTGSPVTAIGPTDKGDKEYWAKWNLIPGDLPVFTEPSGPKEVTVQPGAQATLTASATGATVCQWYVNRGDGAGYVAISGATDMTYTTSPVTLANDGYTYYCEATNLYGTARSKVFTLRVRELGDPPVFIEPDGPREIVVLAGEQGVMSVTATGAVTYQWYINRNDGRGYVALAGATDATYTTSAIKPENDGYTYCCEATNANGTAQSPVFTLRVSQPIVLPQTGDDTPIGLWMLLMLVSLSCLSLLALNRRRQSGER